MREAHSPHSRSRHRRHGANDVGQKFQIFEVAKGNCHAQHQQADAHHEGYGYAQKRDGADGVALLRIAFCHGKMRTAEVDSRCQTHLRKAEGGAQREQIRRVVPRKAARNAQKQGGKQLRSGGDHHAQSHLGVHDGFAAQRHCLDGEKHRPVAADVCGAEHICQTPEQQGEKHRYFPVAGYAQQLHHQRGTYGHAQIHHERLYQRHRKVGKGVVRRAENGKKFLFYQRRKGLFCFAEGAPSATVAGNAAYALLHGAHQQQAGEHQPHRRAYCQQQRHPTRRGQGVPAQHEGGYAVGGEQRVHRSRYAAHYLFVEKVFEVVPQKQLFYAFQ